ncbi:SUMF1/EgtB/PvdO family nonheme iron enzyme [Neptunicella marina]|uniref:SUMF1/EgtB/PvdO family nonheme iron enzyme n=1 Tax=Neptunicella marina TaxID=2125989 RepID=A0A8J6M2D4_9ALTE|nr:formylglycine-generating enzyme family protein [Neptunicella marina]MBC3766117.1 SUMF1/EgtB/PvdO family nonheme iron enzyme [Neptunicella marina]
MNRLVHLAVAVTLLSCSGLAVSASMTVAEIEQQIQQKQSEFDNYNKNLDIEIAASRELEKELGVLRNKSATLEQDRLRALNEMNLAYEKLVEDPSLDIDSSRQNYASAVKAHKENKEAITQKYNEWQTQLNKVEHIRLAKHSLLNKLEGLKEQFNTARVDRLYREFGRQDTILVNHEVTCDREETINKCMDRGKNLAKQKASKRFLDDVYEGLTEAVEAKQHRPYSDGYVQIIRSEVTNSSFSGQGDFSVSMAVEVKGTLKRNEACALLGLDRRYCVSQADQQPGIQVVKAETTPTTQTGSVNTDESVMYELTLRSNVYDDEVFIDGVSYGSTKLQIMLPAGKHNVEVVKRGYQTYSQALDLKESTTLKVDLERTQFAFNKGEKIQDILAGDIAGPNLVVVAAGSFRMGDLTGVGLENEKPVQTKEILESYGIGEAEVTVADFNKFVEQTSYVTDAEKERGCAYYEGGEPVWQENLSWRNPGFTQTDKNPAVCLSLNDAKAYVEWLSEKSGNTYRLPTEVEWEYAARAGKESDYWWGDSIGIDNANCGWCGSQWSNVSTSPVASFKRNDFGLYDTAGNVWEWTTSQNSQSGAVVRGGAWNFAPRLARVSTRMELDPVFRSNYIGFRVLREQSK